MGKLCDDDSDDTIRRDIICHVVLIIPWISLLLLRMVFFPGNERKPQNIQMEYIVCEEQNEWRGHFLSASPKNTATSSTS